MRKTTWTSPSTRSGNSSGNTRASFSHSDTERSHPRRGAGIAQEVPAPRLVTHTLRNIIIDKEQEFFREYQHLLQAIRLRDFTLDRKREFFREYQGLVQSLTH
ncbi:hypothetical protein DPMN_050842 [Dreissena polymorpha]|uniref:Uncharacterized protein n=1 Tax=Dreissena polymorpha TaxID=45954 RepID=A0A9D4CGW2_DREPO|nr:hypothetical protein DPMN_050842 [Dreissena polymorpha]